MSMLKSMLQAQMSGLQLSPRLSASDIKHVEDSMFLIFQVSQHCNQILGLGLGPLLLAERLMTHAL